MIWWISNIYLSKMALWIATSVLRSLVFFQFLFVCPVFSSLSDYIHQGGLIFSCVSISICIPETCSWNCVSISRLIKNTFKPSKMTEHSPLWRICNLPNRSWEVFYEVLANQKTGKVMNTFKWYSDILAYALVSNNSYLDHYQFKLGGENCLISQVLL